MPAHLEIERGYVVNLVTRRITLPGVAAFVDQSRLTRRWPYCSLHRRARIPPRRIDVVVVVVDVAGA